MPVITTYSELTHKKTIHISRETFMSPWKHHDNTFNTRDGAVVALETSQDHNRNKSYKCSPMKSIISHGGNDKTNASDVKMLSNVHFNISTSKIIYID